MVGLWGMAGGKAGGKAVEGGKEGGGKEGGGKEGGRGRGRGYWLVKTEPDAFGWAQQVAHGVEPWTGVRSFAARNNLQAMRRGDRAFFYHSNIGKEIVGVVEVARAAYPDPTVTAETRKGGWVCVDMRAVGPVGEPLSLAAMKEDPALEGFLLLTQSRLSVVPVSAVHWRYLCKRMQCRY